MSETEPPPSPPSPPDPPPTSPSTSPPAASPRIGDAERETAMTALNAHLEAGRITVEEYGERSAKAAAARTADDLRPLFADLPDPRPAILAPAPAAPPPTSPPTSPHPLAAASAPPAPPAEPENSSGLARWAPGISAALPLLAVILFFTIPFANNWVFFLLIPLGGLLFAGTRGNSGWGQDRRDYRQDRRDWRDQRRGW